MPSVLLLHGTADKSVPVASSLLLDDALRGAGAASRVHLLPGKTHTDLLLEDALAGGRDVLAAPHPGLRDRTGAESDNYPCMCPGSWSVWQAGSVHPEGPHTAGGCLQLVK